MSRPKMFGIPLAHIVAKEMGPNLMPATLIRSLRSQRTSGQLSAGLQTVHPLDPQTVTYPCRGVVETYSVRQIDKGLATEGDRNIVILGGSLPDNINPQPNDSITIDGSTYYVIDVERDPAGAVFFCHARSGS